MRPAGSERICVGCREHPQTDHRVLAQILALAPIPVLLLSLHVATVQPSGALLIAALGLGWTQLVGL